MSHLMFYACQDYNRYTKYGRNIYIRRSTSRARSWSPCQTWSQQSETGAGMRAEIKTFYLCFPDKKGMFFL